MNAQKKVDALRKDGFSETQIKDFLCDGEALSRSDIDQDTAEEMFDIVTNQNQGDKMNTKTNKTGDDLVDAVNKGEITENSKIKVDVFSGPMGGYGFRSGQWPITIGGIGFNMFSSLPGSIEMNEQKSMLLRVVKRKIDRAIAQEMYNSNGIMRLKYISQMTRT